MHAWAAYMSFECLEKKSLCVCMFSPLKMWLCVCLCESVCVCVCACSLQAPLPAYSPYPSVGILGDRSKPGSPRLPRLQALCANAARLRNAESFPQVAACADVQCLRPPTVSLTHVGSSHTLRFKCRTYMHPFIFFIFRKFHKRFLSTAWNMCVSSALGFIPPSLTSLSRVTLMLLCCDALPGRVLVLERTDEEMKRGEWRCETLGREERETEREREEEEMRWC